MDYMLNCPLEYYAKWHKNKLSWAARRWDAGKSCPFTQCVDKDLTRSTPKTWSTRVRYLRHLTEEHFHHYPRYDCVYMVKGRQSETCKKGQQHRRRGSLVRHLVEQHKVALGNAAPRLMKMHEGMWSKFRAGAMDHLEMDFGDCGVGKAKGFYKHNVDFNHLHIDEGPLYQEFTEWLNQGKKPSAKRRADSHAKTVKKARTDSSNGRQTVLQKSHTLAKPVTFASTKTDWKSGPTQVVASSISTEDTAANEDFPHLTDVHTPGDESQTLDKDLKEKGRPKKKPEPRREPSPAPEPVPDDALRIQLRKPMYFMPSDLQSFTVQQDLVRNWQDAFHKLVADLANEVSSLTLSSVMEIHHQEKDIQKERAMTAAEKEVAEREEVSEKKYRKAKKMKKEASDNTEYYKKELQNVRDVMDTQNRRFMKVFGHKLTEWDGTKPQIEEWLHEMATAEDSEAVEEEGEAGSDSSSSDSGSEDL